MEKVVCNDEGLGRRAVYGSGSRRASGLRKNPGLEVQFVAVECGKHADRGVAAGVEQS